MTPATWRCINEQCILKNKCAIRWSGMLDFTGHIRFFSAEPHGEHCVHFKKQEEGK